MILSHQKKFIFVHVYKVAGSSIRKVLNPYAAISLRQSNLRDKWISLSKGVPFSSSFDGHVHAAELKERLPNDIFNSYFKFAFVRNPWDWQVSLYLFGLKDKNHYQHALFSSFKNFEEYLDWRVNKELKLQKSFVTDSKGELLVDHVGRFEQLQEEFDFICQQVGIPEVKLPVLNKSNSGSYASYYNDKTIQLVAEAFREDIEFLGYDFDN